MSIVERTVPYRDRQRGLVACGDCGRWFFPIQITDHLISEGRWAASAPSGESRSSLATPPPQHGPAIPDPPYNLPMSRPHVTDGSPCWCQPTAERQPDGTYVVVHREGRN